MADEVVTPPAAVAPPPEKSAVQIFNESLAAQPDAATATPETPAVTPPAPPTFDPASIVIPKGATLPEHFKKYEGKTLADVIELDLKTQQYGSQQRGEADRLRKENENLTARLAAREELTALLTPEKPVVDDWERVGITAETPVWDQPRAALEATRKLAKEDAATLIANTRKEIREEIEAERQADASAVSAINTFDAAKAAIRAEGYAITDDEWSKGLLPYIVPRIAQEATVDPGIAFDATRYVHHFRQLRGAPPLPSIPGESAPPISGRAASITPQFTAPTASNELTQMKEKVASALLSQGKMTKEEAAAYMGGS